MTLTLTLLVNKEALKTSSGLHLQLASVKDETKQREEQKELQTAPHKQGVC